jgi:hypothetical protein
MNTRYFFVFILLIQLIRGQDPEKLSNCKARLSNGKLIDLTELDNPSHPRFIISLSNLT